MPLLRLPAGTDVAEMALFDVDALPMSSVSDESTVAALAASNHLIRFPTGADGGYLLHLFVEEAIPEHLLRFCDPDDKLVGTFCTSNGNVAFGGLESTFVGFKSNPNIRSDGTINPGEYSYTAFHTEFPEDMVTQALRVERTSSELWLSRAPVLLVLATIAVGLTLAVFLKHLFVAPVVFLAGYFGVKWLLRLPAYRAIAARREKANLEFPSIVVELRSNIAVERDTTPASRLHAPNLQR